MVCVQVHFIAYEFPSTLSLFVKKTILIVLSFLFVNYFGCSLQTIMLSLKIALFSPSLSVCLLFMFLPYFISQNFQYDVEKEWQGDILAVCLILLGSFMFLIIKYDISCRFSVMYSCGSAPPFLFSLVILSRMGVEFCQNFSAPIDIII